MVIRQSAHAGRDVTHRAIEHCVILHNPRLVVNYQREDHGNKREPRNQRRIRESDSFNEGGSERGTAVTQRQRYYGRNGWVDEEWGTELGALLRLANEGNHSAGLQQRRDRLATELAEERERPGYNRWGTDWPPNQLKRERPGCSRWALASVNDWPPSQLKRERPGCSRWGTDWPPSQLKRERPGCSR